MGLPARSADRPRESIVALRHHRERIPPVARVRSTMVISSLRGLRERGLLDAYRVRLPEAFHEPILGAVVGAWLGLDVATAHYSACDALGLTVPEQVSMGASVGDAINGTFLGTVVRMARGAGVTPWLVLKQYARLWDRIFDGGDVEIDKLGPKEALIQMHGLSLFSIPYIRVAMRGMHQTGFMLFCNKCYMTDLASGPTKHAYRAAWA
ncbi:MAG TPA: hypothetical protein VGG39_18155 [Polyangiaceae bacterium]|jgi:hypothetical protein